MSAKIEKFTMEVDVDGVLANMDGCYENYVKHIIPDFTEEKYVLGWCVPEIKRDYPEAYEIITSLYTNPKFIRSIPRYSTTEEGIKLLYDIVRKYNGELVVHTHMLDKKCAEMRYEWLEDLKRDTKTKFTINISTGELKTMRKNSLFLLEDNVRNCTVSDAKYKFLVRRCHNRNFTEKDLGICTKSYVVSDIIKAAAEIEQILRKERGIQ